MSYRLRIETVDPADDDAFVTVERIISENELRRILVAIIDESVYMATLNAYALRREQFASSQ